MYSNQELGFILYNNRSVNGVVSNFIPTDINPYELIELEDKLEWCKQGFDNEKFVEINLTELDSSAIDIIIKPDDISRCTDIVLNSELTELERKWLNNRGISNDIIEQFSLRGLTNIKDIGVLTTIGATCHPILKPLLEDGLDGGGIIIPLLEDGKLINCAVRKISDIGKLKYTLACPDIPVWGLDDITGEDIWITEGLFDMMAMRSIGLKTVSVSSAMWSGIQLLKLIRKKPKSISIICDNDQVGYKTGFILKKLLNMNLIPTDTFKCEFGKDAAELIFEKSGKSENIKKINIDRNQIKSMSDDSFNFLKYLKNRKF